MSLFIFLVGAMCGCGAGIMLMCAFVLATEDDQSAARAIEAKRPTLDTFARGVAFGRTLRPPTIVHRHYVVSPETFGRITQDSVTP